MSLHERSDDELKEKLSYGELGDTRKTPTVRSLKCSMRPISRSGTRPAKNEIAGSKPSRRLVTHLAKITR
jgi:hypothetical protein